MLEPCSTFFFLARIQPVDTVRTPSCTPLDANDELNWRHWTCRDNAINATCESCYSASPSRGDRFPGEAPNMCGTVIYRF